MTGLRHVYPLDDFRDHQLEGIDCWCKPSFDEEHNLVVHNSMDDREAYETGKRKKH